MKEGDLLQETLRNRDEIEETSKWKIEDLYPNKARFEEDFKKADEMIARIESVGKDFVKDQESFTDFMKLYVDAGQLFEKVYVYANLKHHEDMTVSENRIRADRAELLESKMSAALAFFEPAIMELDEDILNRYLDSDDNRYLKKFFGDILRLKDHILSQKEERILALASPLAESAETVFEMFNNADADFGTLEKNDTVLTHARFGKFMTSKDRELRKEVFDRYYDLYQRYNNTLAAAYTAKLKAEVFYAKARGYNSSMEMELAASNIPCRVYTNLIETVRSRLDLMHRYMKLRKKALDVDELHMYDIYAPLVPQDDVKITFEEAKKIVSKAVSVMGKEYCDAFENGLEGGFIDVYENKGKRSGAYSWGAYGCHPFVLLNHQDDLNSVFTLIHEMGHAMHTWFSSGNQPYIYAGYKIFVAEVASTVNEALLIKHLLSETEDPKRKAVLVNYFLEQFRTTLFRQTMFAEFEMKVHDMVMKGESIDAEVLNEIYLQLNKDYYGEDMVSDEAIKVEWSRIPHFYSPFYVYQYATGFSAAIALSVRILTGDEDKIGAYLSFLKSGSSDYPIELLKKAGVDMTDRKPVEDALEVFGEHLLIMEELLLGKAW